MNDELIRDRIGDGDAAAAAVGRIQTPNVSKDQHHIHLHDRWMTINSSSSSKICRQVITSNDDQGNCCNDSLWQPILLPVPL